MRNLVCGVVLGLGCFAACGGDAKTSTSGATGGAGGGCCRMDADCPTQEVCVYADGQCGDGEAKSCVYYGPTCPENPVATFCGCDGQSHANNCVLEEDTRAGACPAPPGTFWCGETSCMLGTDYCSADPSAAACQPLSPACQVPGADCSCFEPLTGGCQCSQKDGHFGLSCYTFP